MPGLVVDEAGPRALMETDAAEQLAASGCRAAASSCALSGWTPERVGRFLEEIGLGMYRSRFEEEHVDGAALEALQDAACDGLGVRRFHVKKLLRHVAEAKEAAAQSLQEAGPAAAPSAAGAAQSEEERPPTQLSAEEEKEELKQMLRLENELRLSEDWQARFCAAEKRADTDWMEEVAKLQRQVVESFGYQGKKAIDWKLYRLRTAQHCYPEEPFFREFPLYVRNNRARNGPLFEGALCPDPRLEPLEEQEDAKPTSLLRFGGTGKTGPLLIIGGSHSWPPLRGLMPSLKQLHAELAPLGVRFLFVYTLEAHACDEWPISSGRFNPGGEPVTISKHQNLAERRAAAQRFKELFEVPFPIAVDTMEGDFESQFSTWPFRFYLIKDGLVSFQAQPRKCSYDIAELRERALLLGRHQEIE